MSKLGTPIVVLIGVVAVAIVIVAGVVANGALSDDDDDPVVIAPTASALPEASDDQPASASQADVTGTTDADDVPLSQGEMDRAEKAAIEIAGGGSVTDMDRSDDLGEAYEVEVLTDAGEVDVALDEKFERVPNQPYED